jgi:2-dehydro-3-deoxyphosphogluconate aldolase/(4S)-4-hydroxy-2-oxoglutarate aldolase
MGASDDLRAALSADRLMAIVRYRSGGDFAGAVDALCAGGVGVVEITMNSSGAWATRVDVPDGVLLGAGTVTTTEEVLRVADLGARFVVSPGFDPAIVSAAAEAGLAAIPGVTTASEVLAARRHGVEFFKLFPAGALGVRYLTELRGPFAEEAFVVTGGITLDDIGPWLAAGAFAVALGSSLCGAEAPSSSADAAALTARAQAAVRAARASSGGSG